MKKFITRILQLAVLGGCLAYLFHGIDMEGVFTAFSQYSPYRMLGIFLITIPTYILFGLRFRSLSGGIISVGRGIQGCLLAIAANNVLPARLGEVAKAMFFKQKTTLNLPETMGIIFLERFLDLNIVALATLGAAVVLGLGAMGLPLLGLVFIGWIVMYLIIQRMRTHGVSFSFIPWKTLRNFIRDAMVSVEQALRERPIAIPLGITVVIWTMNFLYVSAIPIWLAGFDMSAIQALGLFAALYIGMSVPGMPGGVGTAEGAIVALLVYYGYPKSEALALALTMRAFNFIPPTLLGLLVFIFSGLDSSIVTFDQSEKSR